MADGFIVRKGGVATEQALAPTITQVATTETSITFTITNNDAETATVLHRVSSATADGESISLATGATSANITISDLDDDTTFTVFATANVTGKVKSNVTQLAISTNEIPAPTITLVSKTDTSVTFTLKNNSVETRDVTFGLTTPPTTTTISLASLATSGNQTFSNLDSDTFITLFAQAEGGLIGQLNVTTDPTLVFTAATGGTTLEYDSGGKRFRSHTFTSDGNFVVSTVGDNVDDRNKVDYLIIAGGAGGGSGFGGGGGAGGYKTTNGTSGGPSPTTEPKVVVTLQSFSVVVGAGGAGSTGNYPNAVRGGQGQTSSALGVSTLGGGGGGSHNTQNTGGNGGSGGGGSLSVGFGGAAGTGTTGQGFAGGNGRYDEGSGDIGASGGGGGAGQLGGIPVNLNNGGVGGNGLANILRNGTSETRAGGGGGSITVAASGSPGAGGAGGGAAGTRTGSAGAGTANTGSGGGGKGSNVIGDGLNSGGKGIVVIRYEIAPSV